MKNNSKSIIPISSHSQEQGSSALIKRGLEQLEEKTQLKNFTFDVIQVNSKGIVVKQYRGQAQYFTEDLGNGVTLDMVSINGGSFIMGSPPSERGRLSTEMEHEVIVQPFFMGKYPVTQAQWRAIALLPKINCDLDPDPSYFKGDNLPVEQVTWVEAKEFCDRLGHLTNRHYRLPREGEWEYACRAGTKSPFYFGETITGELANYRAGETYANEPKGEYRRQTTTVGEFPPNAFGLYDMHGNVYESCLDWWQEYTSTKFPDRAIYAYKRANQDNQVTGELFTGIVGDNSWDEKNGVAPPKLIEELELYINNLPTSISYVVRGGSWFRTADYARSARRPASVPVKRPDCGFRIACNKF